VIKFTLITFILAFFQHLQSFFYISFWLVERHDLSVMECDLGIQILIFKTEIYRLPPGMAWETGGIAGFHDDVSWFKLVYA
jgi:hypothetical protein